MIVTHKIGPEHDADDEDRTRRLLVVEPEPLTRWSLVNYLARWFSVECATTAREAASRLTGTVVDAMVLSDDLPPGEADALDAEAHRGNPGVICVWMVTDPEHRPPPKAGSVRLEKPFQLTKLARLLRVPTSG